MSGLNMETAEGWQIQNYGLGKFLLQNYKIDYYLLLLGMILIEISYRWTLRYASRF